jgi:CHAT domain-containing protein
LAVLSACETGITNLETVNAEYVGLASAFLKAGVRQVVSTLWKVQSDASVLLMLYFYRKVRKGCPPSLALVKAVEWLRGLTDAKLERRYRWMLLRVPPRDKLAGWLNTEVFRLGRMEAEEKEKRKFDMPYFWAAFAITDLREDLR